MTTISIITITYNSEAETHECLLSLEKLLLPKDVSTNIIVVDNASKVPFVLTDNEKKKGVVLLRSEENLGFSGGNNLGITHALSFGAEYVMLLNNDTEVEPHIVTKFLHAIKNNPHVGLAVPKVYFAKGYEYHKDRYTKKELGKVFWYAGGGIDWDNVMSFHRGVDEIDHGQYDKEETVEFATGCCMFLKKDIIQQIGVFDDAYFLYYEDADLCERIKRKGHTILYVPSAIVWHKSAASSGGSGSHLHDYFLTRNRMFFGMKYAPLRAKFALFRESIRFIFAGREWQKRGIQDYYLHKFGKGTFFSKP